MYIREFHVYAHLYAYFPCISPVYIRISTLYMYATNVLYLFEPPPEEEERDKERENERERERAREKPELIYMSVSIK